MTSAYLNASQAPSRAAVDALSGLILLEFGTDWCSHCRAAQPAIEEALQTTQAQQGQQQEEPQKMRIQACQWQHLKVEDGPGRSLGRSYRVKLWPTLVLLRDGQEITRLVRPTLVSDILAAMALARPARLARVGGKE